MGLDDCLEGLGHVHAWQECAVHHVRVQGVVQAIVLAFADDGTHVICILCLLQGCVRAERLRISEYSERAMQQSKACRGLAGAVCCKTAAWLAQTFWDRVNKMRSTPVMAMHILSILRRCMGLLCSGVLQQPCSQNICAIRVGNAPQRCVWRFGPHS